MPSVITQNIGPAVAGGISPQQTGQSPLREATQVLPTQQQVAQITQAATDKVTISPKRSDKERGVQVPKKTEGAFGSQENKDQGSTTTQRTRGRSLRDDDKLDIVA